VARAEICFLKIFSVSETEEEDGSVNLLISYRYDPDFFFSYEFSMVQPNLCEGSMTRVPGPYTACDRFSIQVSIPEMLNYIREWMSDLEDELVALPATRRFEKQQRLLESMFEQFQDLPDEYFTTGEAEELKRKLDELESRLASHISDSSASNRDKEERLTRLHKEIEELKKHLEFLKKPGFMKRFITRLSSTVDEETRKKLIGDGAEATGRFIKGLICGGNGDQKP
jgi:hypothetical protein